MVEKPGFARDDGVAENALFTRDEGVVKKALLSPILEKVDGVGSGKVVLRGCEDGGVGSGKVVLRGCEDGGGVRCRERIPRTAIPAALGVLTATANGEMSCDRVGGLENAAMATWCERSTC